MNTNPVKDISIYDSIKESYINYGFYVNNHRHIPYLLDGLKPVYKKIILTALDEGDFTKTGALIGNLLAKYHDHGDMGISGVVSQLVKTGIFQGEGNFGAVQLLDDNVEAAATRYTKAGLNPVYRELIGGLIDYVPSFQNSFGNKESEYIPFPLPLLCSFGGLGIGVGTGIKIPAFTLKSMLDAYLNDDPKLLKSKYGYEIVNPNELDNIWYRGNGSITYKMKVYRDPADPGGATIIEGDPTEFKPKFKQLREWKNKQMCEIHDISTDIPRVQFSKSYRLRYPSNEDVYQEVEKESKKSLPYYLRVTYQEKVYMIGLRDWIDVTYNNYKNLLEKRRLDKIDQCNRQIEIYSNFQAVADLIVNKHMKDADIAKKLKIKLDIVDAISSKSFKSLRDTDADKVVKKNQDEIAKLNKYDHDKYIKTIISSI